MTKDHQPCTDGLPDSKAADGATVADRDNLFGHRSNETVSVSVALDAHGQGDHGCYDENRRIPPIVLLAIEREVGEAWEFGS